MRRLWLVARHEFIKYVTRRGFLISILMMPAWILIAATVPRWVDSHAPPGSFVMVDRTGGYAAPIRAALARQSGLRELPAPAGLRAARGDSFARQAAALLQAQHGPDAVLVIPAQFGIDRPAVQYWSSGPAKPDLRHFLSEQLTQALRRRALARIAPQASLKALDVSADLKSFDPTKAGNALSFADQVQRYAPSALAFLLVLTIFMNAATLMSAVIEEKSNRVVEVMLSCVSANEFMTGKLIAAIGASLLTLAIWLGGATMATWTMLPGGPGLVLGVVDGLAAGPTIAMMLLCFLCGLLIYASIFLAIGSMTASMQDAQALIGPTYLLIMAPLIIIPALMRDPNGSIATALTWIPIYTPFLMMFRMPWHPPAIEVWLGAALMIATAAFLVWQMGRVFANNVLTAERPPKLGALLRGLARGA